MKRLTQPTSGPTKSCVFLHEETLGKLGLGWMTLLLKHGMRIRQAKRSTEDKTQATNSP
jgi:hypothetical protein